MHHHVGHPQVEQRFLVERFARATGADAAVLVTAQNGTADAFEYRAPLQEDLEVCPFTEVAVDALKWSQTARMQPMVGPGVGLSGVLLAPVTGPKGPVGVLCGAFARLPLVKNDPLLWLADGYAKTLSLCFEDRGFAQLVAAARVDPLTGCLNSDAVRERVDEEVARARRYDRELTCCFLDVDDFKCVNDRWGHMLGDDVLTRIGNVLLDGARSSDSVGRFGGDEFIVLLPETGIEVAADLAARLRATLRHSAGALLDQDISVSMGLAGWHAGETSREFLTRADDALLAAKAAGGGLALAGSDGSPPQSAGSSAVEAGERQAVEIPARSLGRRSA